MSVYVYLFIVHIKSNKHQSNSSYDKQLDIIVSKLYL
jgi:hypothetical protein